MNDENGRRFGHTLGISRLTIPNAKRAFGMIETYISRYLQLETQNTYPHFSQHVHLPRKTQLKRMRHCSLAETNKRSSARCASGLGTRRTPSPVLACTRYKHPTRVLSTCRIEKGDVNSFRKAQERSLHRQFARVPFLVGE